MEYVSRECERFAVVLFYNGIAEREIIKSDIVISKGSLGVDSRIAEMRRFISGFGNIDFLSLDCDVIYDSFSNLETWDAEPPFVKAIAHDMDAVYSSEPSYDNYFKRAYPDAEHVLVDPPRMIVPISATQIRAMSDEDGEKRR